MAQPIGQPAPARIAGLREELKLHEGPPDRAGDPTWTLEDPLRDRYFRLGAVELEMLARWHLGSPAHIAEAVNRETRHRMAAENVEQLAQFLAASNLLQVAGEEANERLLQQVRQQRMHWTKWLLKNYLFVRLPLLRPSEFLKRTQHLVAPFYSRAFLWLTLLAGLLGLSMATRQWESFLHTFLHVFTLEGALLAGAALILSKVLHELGHAYTATRAGCRVGTMGVAFLVMWPVLYTDTSGAWTVKGRKQRLAIGGAGMMVETALACWATLAWNFLPDGPLRSAVFTLATTTWILTLLVNLNPLMRFDGYFLLSDFLDVPNLQERAFRLARWRLREALFGLNEPRPEQFDREQSRILLIYAYATWIYRFFLFLGIALLVYHLFFKLLGLFLFAVEIGWFILRPIAAELAEWSKRRGDYRWNRNTAFAALGLALLLALGFLPWQRSVEAPAIIRAADQAQLYMPVAGRLEQIAATQGMEVERGELLFRIDAPDLRHELAQLDRDIAGLTRQSSFQIFSRDMAAQLPVIRRNLDAALIRREALRQDMQRLELHAPISGSLAEIADPLSVGDWLGKGEWLATLTGPDGAVVEAYLDEAKLGRLRNGASARFIPDDPLGTAIPLELVEIAATATRRLSSAPELASLHGGPISAAREEDGAPIPEQAIYRLTLRGLPGSPGPGMALRGHVVIDAEAVSPAGSLLRQVIATFIRESGF